MFYTAGVDICSTKSMWEFLANHFTYDTMNSWNRLESIANNVKLYNLKLEGDWCNVLKYLTDNVDCGGLQDIIDGEIRAFDEKWYPNYRVGFNGRSNGYLVLYNADNNCSVLPPCVTSYESYEDFKKDVKSYWNGYKVSDFNYELREAVEVVRDFDKLCDTLRDIVNGYSKRNFNTDKLTDAVERFYCTYGDDLENFNIIGPEVEGDRVKLNDISMSKAFMDCFFDCFYDAKDEVNIDDECEYVWLKEN